MALREIENNKPETIESSSKSITFYGLLYNI